MAIDYYDKALKIIEKESERRIPLANIGTLYRYLSFPDSSLFYLHEAERITLEGKDSTGLREIYFSLAETYTDLGEIYEASEYYKKSISVSHVSRQKSNAIAFINSYSDSTFISKQRLDTLTQEISQRKRINLILWCSILLVILLSFIIIYRNRRQAKLQRIQLQQESMEVRKEKQELSQTVDLLEKKISARKPGDFAEQMFTLNNKRKDTFQLGSISYITVIDKTLTFYHIDGVKKFYMEGTLKKFYKNELSKIPIFIRIHRSYVINILDVQQRQKESVLLSNEVRIPVPPPHRQKLSDAFRWLDSFSI